jgi:hypothetical protein
MEFVPFMNTQEGLSLTPAQWQACGVKSFAYDAALMLQRPGFLIPFDIKQNGVCSGYVILDTRKVSCKKSTSIQFRMTDGVLKTADLDDFSQWVDGLNADLVIWSDLFPEQCLKTPRILEKELNSLYCLSNQPAEWAFSGEVLLSNGEHYSILAPHFEQDFNVLAENCDCQTCHAGFTRSYLHHLLQHTPLLAQRFLMSHNIFQAMRQPLLF